MDIEYTEKKQEFAMQIYFHPLISLIAGIIILIYPRLLNYVVAIYLIVIGIVGLINSYQLPQ